MLTEKNRDSKNIFIYMWELNGKATALWPQGSIL